MTPGARALHHGQHELPSSVVRPEDVAFHVDGALSASDSVEHRRIELIGVGQHFEAAVVMNRAQR
jgi:hypothetical protein